MTENDREVEGVMVSTERVEFLGLPFDLMQRQQLIDFIAGREPERFEYVVTPNVDHVVRAGKDAQLPPLYREAVLSVCDSRILLRLARAKGLLIPELITGSDLTAALFEQVIEPDQAVTVIGAAPAVVDRIRQRYGLERVQHYNPPMGFIHNAAEVQACCRFVVENPARWVFLAVGSPQQERLALALKRTAGAQGLGLCIGASLLFLAGAERRAPLWMQQSGLEWLYRLRQNPRRLWRRYLVDNPQVFYLWAKSPRLEAGAGTWRVLSEQQNPGAAERQHRVTP